MKVMKSITSIACASLMAMTMAINVCAAGITAEPDEIPEPVYAIELREDGYQYVVNENDPTEKVTGAIYIEALGGTYYCDNHGRLITNSFVEDVDGNEIYVDSEGEKVTDKWVEYKGKRYYLDSFGDKMADEMYEIKGKTYYFNEDGSAHKGLLKYEGNYYYFSKTSYAMVKSVRVQIKNAVYYFGKDGTMQTGWVRIGNDAFYFGNDGKMFTGKKTINGKTYNFAKDGHLITNK